MSPSLLQRVTGCILSNVNTPSITPVIGQPPNETPQPIYQNNNVPPKPTAGKKHLRGSKGQVEIHSAELWTYPSNQIQ